MIPCEAWWNSITGPRMFIKDVAESLLKQSQVIIVPDDLPWRHEMRKEIESNLRSALESTDVSIQFRDEDDMGELAAKPGEYILATFALNDVAGRYRSKSSKTIQEYISEHLVLQDTILWVKGLSKENAFAWITFLKGFPSHDVKSGLIVVEVRDDLGLNSEYPDNSVVYSRYLNGYNLQLFNSFLLDDKTKLPERNKLYLAALAAHLCITDAEISAEFLERYLQMKVNPLDAIQEIADDDQFSRRGTGSKSKHVLALSRRGDVIGLLKRIWEAQLQVLFPIVEAKRIAFIKPMERELQYLLDRFSVYQFADQVRNPKDLEWGTLLYLMEKYDERYVPFQDNKSRAYVRKYRDYRNHLAHMDALERDSVIDILSK